MLLASALWPSSAKPTTWKSGEAPSKRNEASHRDPHPVVVSELSADEAEEFDEAEEEETWERATSDAVESETKNT